MLNKLKLLESEDYARLLVTKYAIDMLTDYISGNDHDLEIGAESGTIDKWDDIVIIKSDQTRQHFQIKNQRSDFCTKKTDRSEYLKKGTADKEYYSELDKTLTSLSQHLKKDDHSIRREFVLITPNHSVKVKNEIFLHQFEELCNKTREESASFQKFISDYIDSPGIKYTQNMVTWLKSWCGFDDEKHVFDAAKILKYIMPGNDENIKNESLDKLDRYFINSKTVYKNLRSYTIENSIFANSLTPEGLFQQVKGNLKSDVSLWTRYTKTDSGWEKSGINHSTNDDTEPASKVVRSLWSSDTTEKKLIIDETAQKADNNDKLMTNLNRLAIHLQGAKRIEVNNPDDFTTKIKNSCGHTLGISKNDFEDLPIRILNDEGSNSIKKSFSTRSELQLESEELTNQMYAEVWTEIKSKVNSQIQNGADIECVEILDVMEARWNFWLTELDIPEKYVIFLKSMMQLNAEGKINVDLRIGPKTKDIIADSILLLIFVSVGLDTTEISWADSQEKLRPIALHFYTSGDITKRIGSIPQEGLSREKGQVLILSGTDKESRLVKGDLIYSNLTQNHATGSSKSHRLYTTRELIDNYGSSLSQLRSYLSTKFNAEDDSLRNDIQNQLPNHDFIPNHPSN